MKRTVMIRVDKKFLDQLEKMRQEIQKEQRRVVNLTDVTRVVVIKKKLKNI